MIDFSKAPEGATHYRTIVSVPFVEWWKVADGKNWWWRGGGMEYWDLYIISGAYADENLKKIPVKTECGSWYQKGELPPVGINCEFYNKHAGVWCDGKVIAYNGLGACWFEGEGIVNCEIPGAFRPIQSDRDKTIEAAIIPICNAKDTLMTGAEAKLIAESLYDNGFLRLPEEKK